MTDRESNAIAKLKECGYEVHIRPATGSQWDGWWLVTRDGRETARMDNLAALVELAEAIYAARWRKVTPSA